MAESGAIPLDYHSKEEQRIPRKAESHIISKLSLLKVSLFYCYITKYPLKRAKIQKHRKSSSFIVNLVRILHLANFDLFLGIFMENNSFYSFLDPPGPLRAQKSGFAPKILGKSDSENYP